MKFTMVTFMATMLAITSATPSFTSEAAINANKLMQRDCDCAGLKACESNCGAFGGGAGYVGCLASCTDSVGCTETTMCFACADGSAVAGDSQADACVNNGGPCLDSDGNPDNTC